jgi:anti-sigma B factor antagonist
MVADRRAETGPSFSLELEPAREEVRVQAVGELDLAAAPMLDEQVGELLAAGFKQVVIDLHRVTFIDLTGVRLLLKLAEDARDDGWRLSLLQPGGQVHRLLKLTGALEQMPLQTPLMQLPSLTQA